jgi:hypothetical protein
MPSEETKAVFVREFHWGRLKGRIGFAAKASPAPQSFPRDFIAAAIAAGAAVPVEKPAARRGKTPRKQS